MDLILTLMTPAAFVTALLIGLFAGLVKGIVGFGMPMIMISGMSTVLSPELALAGLILPTLASNGMQAFRQGIAAAWASVYRFRLFLAVGGVVLIGSAQLVTVLPPAVLFLFIGVFVAGFAAMKLVGWQPKVSEGTPWVEAVVGAFAGFTGGLSGIWGPPTVAYLTAIDTPKADHVRVQGVIYGLGALALFFAHIQTGIVRGRDDPVFGHLDYSGSRRNAPWVPISGPYCAGDVHAADIDCVVCCRAEPDPTRSARVTAQRKRRATSTWAHLSSPIAGVKP